MKIAIAAYNYPVEVGGIPVEVGGGGLYATLLAQALAAQGEDVHIFAARKLGDGIKLKAGQLHFHQVRSFSGPLAYVSYWKSLLRKIRSVASRTGSFDVVNSMQSLGFGLPRHDRAWKLNVCTLFHLSQVTKEETQIRLISRIRGFSGELGLQSLYEKRCINRADCVITVSEHTKREISRRYNKPSDSFGVIPPAVPPEIRRLSEMQLEELQGQYHSLNKSNNILFVGKVYFRKNIDFLLESFIGVLKNQDATLWIVGPGNLDLYREHARKLGIEKNVVFTDAIDGSSLVQLYKLCDVFAFPSVSEGFGIVMAEAMINGLPIVGINSTSIPEVAKGCGILVEPGDLNGFAQAISSLLENEKMRQSLGGAGRRKAAREYSDWGHVSHKTINFYLEQRELLSR